MKIIWKSGLNLKNEERLAILKMSDQQKWDRMMAIINIGRKEPVTFEKRKIEWK